MYLLFYYIGSSIIGWSGGFFWSYFGWDGVIGMICVLLGFTYLLSVGIKREIATIAKEYKAKGFS
jgi:MFS transporter, YNFM family, putative membrane transport protein